MNRIGLAAAVALAALGGSASHASTPAAWAALDRQVTRSCLAAAGLTRAKIVPDKASFSDRVPVELRIVEGYNRESVVDVKLCVYDRRTKRATTVDGVGRLGVNRR